MRPCCPLCRAHGPVPLDRARTCARCGTEFPQASVGEGPAVLLLLDSEDADPGLAAAERILTELDPDAAIGEVPIGAASPEDAPYLSALGLYGGAHYGRHAEPPLPSPDLDWIARALASVELPEGPALVLGAATAGEALVLPDDREVVALDGSIPLLCFASALAGTDHALPVQVTPGRWTARALRLPEPLRERLRRVQLVAADARVPPFEPQSFAIVLALNLLDSITHPRELLHRAAELLVPGGVLLLSAPFQWSDDVTPPERRLDAEIPPTVEHAPAIEARIEAELPGLRLRWRDRDVPWPLRIHDRLRSEFRLHAMLLRRE